MHVHDTKPQWHALATVDQEYFVASKLACIWAKRWMRFNFVNLACVRNYFNPEIFIHGVFMLWCSMTAYEMESRMRGYHVYKDIRMGCNDWRRSLCKREPFNGVDRYANSYKIFSILIYFMYLNFVQQWSHRNLFNGESSQSTVYQIITYFYEHSRYVQPC